MSPFGRRLFVTQLLAAFALAPTMYGQHDDRTYWDKVYSANQSIFSRRPTALLVEAINGRRPGKAVDIGMGEGRNSIFLAEKGWDITGFDPSEEGVRQARERARKLGLRLRALVAKEQDFELGVARWDLILLTYVRQLQPGDADRFARALKPRGVFVYENNNAGKQNDLLRYFLGWRILRFEDVDTRSDWHPDRIQRVERLVAEKPVS